MSDGSHRANKNLISEFTNTTLIKYNQYQKANKKIDNLTDYLRKNNHCDEPTSKEIERQIKLVFCDLYKSLDTPDFMDETNNEMISSIQEIAAYRIPADVIKPAYVINMIIKILGVLESKEITVARGAAFAQKMLVELLPILESMLTERNIDSEKIKATVSDCFDENDLFIPDNAKIEKLGYSIKGIKGETPVFVMQKFEKGDCEARYIGDNSKPCMNKTESGKICCSDHHPLTQEEKRIINENKSGTFSSNESEIAISESSNSSNTENLVSNKCKYINGKGKEQCKNAACVGGFCTKCHKKHSDDFSILKSNDYCTIIIASGLNKGKVCGKKSCEKGLHICTGHYEKANVGNIEKCPYMTENGTICNAKIKNPTHKACGKHLNCTSYINYEPERKKSEAQLEWEEEQREQQNKPIQYCEAVCGNGNVCNHKAGHIIDISIVEGITNDKIVCWMHHESLRKKKEKEIEIGKTHQCHAKCKTTGKQCRIKNVPECDLYCGTHYDYDPEDQCGAFDMKKFDRCLKTCENGKYFCTTHKDYTADPIKDEGDVMIIQRWIRTQQYFAYMSQYTVVCVDPPKKLLKLKIVEDKPANQKPLRLIVEGEGYGLDYFCSDSEEESACTEESELEVIQPVGQPIVEIKPKRSILPEEFELVNKATGWTEEQIRIMKGKLIYKRFLGPKKKFDLERSIFETKKHLEKYFTTAINKTNAKYKGCKTQFENLIRATYHDLSVSVENVIGLFGAQRFWSRTNILENCKDSLKDLRNLEKNHNDRIAGLPVPIITKKLVEMDIKKYVNAFNDAIYTVKKEQKEDSKYIKEFEQFLSGHTKRSKNKYVENREDKRKELNKKYKIYFEKYIVRFAKVALHTENSQGRSFGFANYFIDLLHKKPLDYTRFRDAYGGEIRNEDGQKAFYCDVFSIITKIIEDYNNKDGDKLMDYIDVDISTNLSSSEHQISLSQELRECQRTGKTTSTFTSMLDVGKVERFAAKNGFYDHDDWVFDDETRPEFFGNFPGFYGNFLEVQARENNYPNYDLPRDTAPDIKVARWVNSGNKGMREEMPAEIKQTYENNVEDILAMYV